MHHGVGSWGELFAGGTISDLPEAVSRRRTTRQRRSSCVASHRTRAAHRNRSALMQKMRRLTKVKHHDTILADYSK